MLFPKKGCGSSPKGCLGKGYRELFLLPNKNTGEEPSWLPSGAHGPVYFQPGVTHFFPAALFLSHSLSCSAAGPPGRSPNPPSPPLAHPHPSPSGKPRAAASARTTVPAWLPNPGASFWEPNTPQNPPPRAQLHLPVCTSNSEAPVWGERLFIATTHHPAHVAAQALRSTRPCLSPNDS